MPEVSKRIEIPGKPGTEDIIKADKSKVTKLPTAGPKQMLESAIADVKIGAEDSIELGMTTPEDERNYLSNERKEAEEVLDPRFNTQAGKKPIKP